MPQVSSVICCESSPHKASRSVRLSRTMGEVGLTYLLYNDATEAVPDKDDRNALYRSQQYNAEVLGEFVLDALIGGISTAALV
jgi:hypothetical protein